MPKLILKLLSVSVVAVATVFLLLQSPSPPAFADAPAKQKLEFLSSTPQPDDIERPLSPLFALVIGIDEYLSNEISDLSGAVNDANAFDAFLQETLRVPKSQIKNLRNEEATRVVIETEVKNLGDNPAIKDNDAIVIFFAGHGAEASAPFGLPRAQRKIQMLVPYDFIPSGSDNSEEGQGVPDMRLSRLLADLAAKKSDNIVVILDCCNSGSGTRMDDGDPTSAIRGINLPQNYTVSHDLLHGIEPDAWARASVVAKGFQKTGLLSHVLLSACKPEQKAREKYGRGIFTSALLSFLQKNDLDKLTYKDVITNLPDLPGQDPQCEGVHQSRFLFNSKLAVPQGELYPIRASSDTPGQYVLEAGEAHGITKNAQLVVFADRTMDDEFGTVIVSSTTAFTAKCQFSPRGNETPFRLNASGYALQTRVGERRDVRLFIEPDKRLLRVFHRIVREMQARERAFHLVESRDEEPDLVVATDGDHVHFEIMDKLCLQHGLTHMPFEVKIDYSDGIRHIVQRSVDFYRHLHHSIKRSRFARKVTLECMKLKQTGEFTETSEEVLMPDPNGDNLNIGDVIMIDVDEDAIYGFNITNTLSTPLYVSMFYFGISDLSIAPYYQPGSAKGGVVDLSLHPNKSLTIGYGDSGTVPHRFTLRKGQDVDVGFLKLFFSTEYMDLSGISQQSPFYDHRSDKPYRPKKMRLWDIMSVAVVQKHGKGSS